MLVTCVISIVPLIRLISDCIVVSLTINTHRSLYDETGIDLENICYYKDDTHYFVMTAKKSSLLQRGVLINDYSDTRALLASTNIDRSQLLAYARDAAKWTTGNG